MQTISDLEKVTRGCEKLKRAAQKKVKGGWFQDDPVVKHIIIGEYAIYGVVLRTHTFPFTNEVCGVEFIMNFEEAAQVLEMPLQRSRVLQAA